MDKQFKFSRPWPLPLYFEIENHFILFLRKCSWWWRYRNVHILNVTTWLCVDMYTICIYIYKCMYVCICVCIHVHVCHTYLVCHEYIGTLWLWGFTLLINSRNDCRRGAWYPRQQLQICNNNHAGMVRCLSWFPWTPLPRPQRSHVRQPRVSPRNVRHSSDPWEENRICFLGGKKSLRRNEGVLPVPRGEFDWFWLVVDYIIREHFASLFWSSGTNCWSP